MKRLMFEKKHLMVNMNFVPTGFARSFDSVRSEIFLGLKSNRKVILHFLILPQFCNFTP